MHHFRTLLSFAASAVRWKSELPAPFWRYFAAAGCFDVGLFAFFLLYNIYLLQIGFTERLVGYISAAMATGSLIGSFLAAMAITRWDIRKCLTATVAVIAAISAGRAVLTQAPFLISLAALAGAAMSIWAVCIAPTVAALTTERSRPRAFSFIFAAGIGLGVIGGLVGGNLPEILQQSTVSRTSALRISLLLSCCPVIGAAFILRKLPRLQAAAATRTPFRLTPFLRRYLVAIALWHLGTGSFNPFFNAFLTRLGYGVSRIGAIFSVSQAMQTLAVLAAPLVLRRLGLTRGIAAMETATALFAFCIALTTQSAGVIAAYGAYMACQYMSEPGMNALLMDSVPDEERGGASALNFSVAFAAQAIASSAAGTAIPRIGYVNVISVAGMLCLTAAIAFYLLGRQSLLPQKSALQPASETDPSGAPAPTRDERFG